MQSTVVIGANYGDEGKGLITDFEVRRTGAEYVARFNGGAQAGHTVHSEGNRHVFGHVGAGTFAGASTYLSSKFIVNPFLLRKELDALGKLGLAPRITAHENARVSTLFDMALNAMAELARGEKRHGSCGVGINETVTRHETYPLTLHDVLTKPPEQLARLLEVIKREYLPQRMKRLGITEVPSEYRSTIFADSDLTQAQALSQLGKLLCHPPRSPVKVVFEGAQGLALDEFLGTFPHVTRSITGLPSAIIAASELQVTKLRPVYVTRAYLTRHGAGPMPHEGVEFGAYSVNDQTNIDNKWQGSLRFAPLNLPLLRRLINSDLTRAGLVAQAHDVEILRPTLAVTCMDQLHGDMTVVDLNDELRTIRTSYLPRLLADQLNVHVSHVSRGPDARDIEFFELT